MYSSSLQAPKIWLIDPTYTQQTVAADTIPMAIGGIATYLEEHLPKLSPVKIFKYPEEILGELEISRPDILGLSNYVWNYELSREIAKFFKHLNPNGVTVVGGPNYPIDNLARKDFLKRNELEFDYYVSGEGEVAFLNLVKCLIECGFEKGMVASRELGSVHFLYEGEYIFTNKLDRLKELDVIPSPYTSGKLDKFFDGKLMPLLQTNRGCPFSCTFCVEGDDYYTKVRKYSAERVSADVEYIGRKIDSVSSAGARRDLFIADSNFGMYPSDLHTASALAKSKRDYAWPDYINVATGKNSKERVIETAKILDGSLRLSGSVQSLDSEVLENIKRKNISPERLVELGLHTKTIGANSYSEIILGLPGDSKAKHFQTIAKVMDAGFNIILPWQLMLIHGSELSSKQQRTKYGFETKFRVLPRCYGNWAVSDKTFSNGQFKSVEIEEIVVASNTLSFQDYIECRIFNYFVATYYNDALFKPVIDFLNALGVRSYDFIFNLMQIGKDSKYHELIDSFVGDTQDELWNDREELEQYALQDSNITKYISGELGKNNLFFHRAKAYCRHLDDMKNLVIETFEKTIPSGITELEKNYGRELIDFCATSSIGLLQTNFDEITKQYSFNFLEDIKKGELKPVNNPKKPYRFKFFFSGETKDLVERSLATHGTDLVGVARILSRIFVKKLYRKVAVA